MDNIIDVSNEFENCIKAEAKNKNVLILRKLDKPIKRFDGKKTNYELEHRWLSKEVTETTKDNVVCVQGNDFSYWQKTELNLNKKLFDQVNLF